MVHDGVVPRLVPSVRTVAPTVLGGRCEDAVDLDRRGPGSTVRAGSLGAVPDDAADPVVGQAADLYLSLGRVLRLLRRAGTPGDLSPGSASVLATIVTQGPMRLGDVAAREQLAAPTVSRIVTVLEQGDLVSRAADPTDGRASLLAATQRGADLVLGVTSQRSRVLAERMHDLTAEQRAGLLDGLLALERAMAPEGAAGEPAR